MSDFFIWLAIVFCLTQSAIFSGLNLAIFSLNRLDLEITARNNNDIGIKRVLGLRQNANFTLTTILWGNVAINVLLTLLADSILAGVSAFMFSAVVITFAGEIFPQAYFSRHALMMAVRLAPVLRLYQFLLWPVAWPSGKLLDAWIGPEGIPWLGEQELQQILEQHGRDRTTEISHVEATGAVNFLTLDDLPVNQEGEWLDPKSIFCLPFQAGQPVFPEIGRNTSDPFLKQIAACGKKWIVLIDTENEPRLVANAPALLRAALFGQITFNPIHFCHRPLVVRDPLLPLGQALTHLTVQPEHPEDDVIDKDLILVWYQNKHRIITGSDLLGRLLRRIARQKP